MNSWISLLLRSVLMVQISLGRMRFHDEMATCLLLAATTGEPKLKVLGKRGSTKVHSIRSVTSFTGLKEPLKKRLHSLREKNGWTSTEKFLAR